MLKPSIDKLLQKSSSKYVLVTAVYKRVHQLEDDQDRPLIDKPISQKSIGIALEEIEANKIKIKK